MNVFKILNLKFMDSKYSLLSPSAILQKINPLKIRSILLSTKDWLWQEYFQCCSILQREWHINSYRLKHIIVKHCWKGTRYRLQSRKFKVRYTRQQQSPNFEIFPICDRTIDLIWPNLKDKRRGILHTTYYNTYFGFRPK